MKPFKVLAQSHGTLTVKPTFRDAATRVPLPDIDIQFHKGNAVWDSSKSKFSDADLKFIREYIEERNKRGDVNYTIIEEEVEAPEPRVEEPKVITSSGPRTTAHLPKGK